MPIYMYQFSYTPEAWSALSENPQDQTEAIRALIEQQEGRLLAFYYCFGEYDGLIIFEAPTNIAAAAFAVASAGQLKASKTTVLLTAEEGIEVMQRVRPT